MSPGLFGFSGGEERPRLTIFALDDEGEIRELLKEGLEELGHTVETFWSGPELFARLKQERPDVILLDINMPVASGWKVRKLLNRFKETRRIPVIAVTSAGDERVAQQARDRFGFADYVRKPFEIPALEARIRQVTEQPAPGQPSRPEAQPDREPAQGTQPTSGTATSAPEPDPAPAPTDPPTKQPSKPALDHDPEDLEPAIVEAVEIEPLEPGPEPTPPGDPAPEPNPEPELAPEALDLTNLPPLDIALAPMWQPAPEALGNRSPSADLKPTEQASTHASPPPDRASAPAPLTPGASGTGTGPATQPEPTREHIGAFDAAGPFTLVATLQTDLEGTWEIFELSAWLAPNTRPVAPPTSVPEAATNLSELFASLDAPILSPPAIQDPARPISRPRDQAPRLEPAPLEREHPTAGTVFIAEDEASIRELVQTLMEDAGFEVEAFSDGDALLERIEHAHPDLVLVDLEMPGAGGETVLRQLQRDPGTRSIPVVAVTGKGTERSAEVAKEILGFADYVRKPFEAGDLVARARDALASSGDTADP